MTIVPSTNCRIVRPREIRARKRPTNDAQATHQAQKNSVQSCIHSWVSVKAKVSIVLAGKVRTKSPTFITTALSRNDVRPVTSTQPASARARITLSWDRSRMPLSTPVVADTAATVTARTASADLCRRAHRDAEDHVEPDVEEHHADAQAGGDTEDGAEDRGRVHGMPERAVHALAEDRVERGPHREGQVLAVGEVGQGQTHEGIHRPAGDAVVEQGPHGGVTGRGHGARLAHGRSGVLRDRLDDRVEHHVGADAGREEHRRPGEGRELRPGVVGAQPDAAVAGDPQEDHEADDHGGEGDVEPPEAGADATHDLADHLLRVARRHHGPQGDQADARERGDEHRPPDRGPAPRGRASATWRWLVELGGHRGLRVTVRTLRGSPGGWSGEPSRCR